MNQLLDLLVSSLPAVPTGVCFRLAVETDLLPLHADFYAHQPKLRFMDYFHRMLKRQQRGNSYWLIVETGQSIIANGMLLIYAHGAELANLQVAEKHRGQGIGTALIQLLTRLAQQLGQGGVEIGVSADNERAMTLYERLGFAEDRWLHLPAGESAIILRREV